MTSAQIQEVLQSGDWLEPKAWNMRLTQPSHYPVLALSEVQHQRILAAYREAGDTHWRTRRTGATDEVRLAGGILSQVATDHGGRLYLIQGRDLERAHDKLSLIFRTFGRLAKENRQDLPGRISMYNRECRRVWDEICTQPKIPFDPFNL